MQFSFFQNRKSFIFSCRVLLQLYQTFQVKCSILDSFLKIFFSAFVFHSAKFFLHSSVSPLLLIFRCFFFVYFIFAGCFWNLTYNIQCIFHFQFNVHTPFHRKTCSNQHTQHIHRYRKADSKFEPKLETYNSILWQHLFYFCHFMVKQMKRKHETYCICALYIAVDYVFFLYTLCIIRLVKSLNCRQNCIPLAIRTFHWINIWDLLELSTGSAKW